MYLVGLSQRVVLFLLLLLHCVTSIADGNLFGLGEANVSVQCQLVSAGDEACIISVSEECKEIAGSIVGIFFSLSVKSVASCI